MSSLELEDDALSLRRNNVQKSDKLSGFRKGKSDRLSGLGCKQGLYYAITTQKLVKIYNNPLSHPYWIQILILLNLPPNFTAQNYKLKICLSNFAANSVQFNFTILQHTFELSCSDSNVSLTIYFGAVKTGSEILQRRKVCLYVHKYIDGS